VFTQYCRASADFRPFFFVMRLARLNCSIARRQ
jgi:hypothetical protein